MTDWQAEGLLEDVEGEEARAARVALLERLARDGATLEELRAACREGRLALLPLERLMTPDGPRLSANELAREVGVEREFLDRVWRALGLALRDPDERAFTQDDVDAARTVAFFRESGIPDETIVEITRVMGRGMADLVATLEDTALSELAADGASELDVALSWATAVRDLAPRLDPLLGYVLAVHRRDRVRNAFAEAAGSERVTGSASRRVAIGFADLVGFTRLGEELPADELGAVARRLDELAADAVASPVRVVKTIGDAVMLASSDACALVEAMLALVAAADAEGERFPQLRGGVAAGEAVPRGGDWYGRPVNLASRLTGFARPGSVVVDAAARDAIEEAAQGAAASLRWTRVGRRRFKGIRDEVAVYRVRAGAHGD